MGQAKRHRESVFQRSGQMCVYCGGAALATTVDHMPPKIIFDGKDRPAGLEFAACESCNVGARNVDQVCALLSRIYPDNTDATASADLEKLLVAVSNNNPGLLRELTAPPAQTKHVMRRLGMASSGGGVLRIGTPRVRKMMELFGARMALALHFEETGIILPIEGTVFVRIYSNIDLFEGRIPNELFDMLPPPSTLEQGRKNAADQFRYGVRAVDAGQATMSFASFRKSFALLMFCGVGGVFSDASDLHDAVPYRPGALSER